MSEHQDFLDEIVADDPANRHLAASLRSWRDAQPGNPVAPDGHLENLFSQQPPVKQPAKWRLWMQRPAIAFGASFAAVLLLGAGAFALVSQNGETTEVAAPSTSALSAQEATTALAEITLPQDLTDQTGYAECVFDQLSGWFTSGFASEDAPQIVAECGNPPIPDLGPEAAAYRTELQAWANCVAGELQAVLPELPALLKAGGEEPAGFDECGDPPDPRDFGLELPFIDFEWQSLDPSQLNFGGFNFGDFNLEDLDFGDFNLEDFNVEDFLADLPPGLLPEDFNLEDLKARFENFDIEGLDLESLFSQFGEFNLEDLEGFEDFNLEGLDLESLFSQFGEFNLEDFQGFEDFDLDKLFAELFDGAGHHGDSSE